MAKIPVHIITCDRCAKELGREETSHENDPPAYYRQVTKVVDMKVVTDERRLDHLCKRCKGEVEELDERIFSDSRVRKTAAETPEAKQETTNA